MELTFEHSQKVADGHNPAGYHAPDNVFQVMFTSEGKLNATTTPTPYGNFEAREFIIPYEVAMDEAVGGLRVTYLPRINLFAHWQAEDLHRLALMVLKQDASPYLNEGSITFREDDPGATISLSLENPKGLFAAERTAGINPGTRISVWFAMGDSRRMQIGLFYMDRVNYDLLSPIIPIEGRNSICKFLKDQSFDEESVHEGQNTIELFGSIMGLAGVDRYSVEEEEYKARFTWPADKKIWDGIKEVLDQLPGWRIREMHDGEIVIGHEDTYDRFGEGIYTFNRGEDCFSRSITRDDQHTYSRVCVWFKRTDDDPVYVYRDVDFLPGWNMPRRKTIYLEMLENSDPDVAGLVADELAARYASAGIIETFLSPFRPHLQPGDEAHIIEPGHLTRQIGIVTEVEHRFGRNGFYTQFTVDSGGRLGKPMIKEYMDRIARGINIPRGSFESLEEEEEV